MKRLLLFLCIPVLAWYISANWLQVMLIQGRSMEPAYHHMQFVVLNRYDRVFQRGDVAAFRCEGLSSILVKRIAAIPGDTAVIRDGTLYVNDQVSTVYPDIGLFFYAGMLEEQIVLGPGEYLFLGDNTAESRDSRYPEVGLVQESQIYGRIAFKRG